jgi:dTDP-4-dehydrorhamnose reductase
VIYGDGIEVKPNFFLWVLNNLKQNKEISVVDDQYNNPTLAEDLAKGTELILSQEALGIYHMAGVEYLNRYEFALAIAEYFHLDKQLITPIKTQQLKQASRRPEFGGLKIEKAQNQLGYQPKSLQSSFAYLKRKVLADE